MIFHVWVFQKKNVNFFLKPYFNKKRHYSLSMDIMMPFLISISEHKWHFEPVYINNNFFHLQNTSLKNDLK